MPEPSCLMVLKAAVEKIEINKFIVNEHYIHQIKQ